MAALDRIFKDYMPRSRIGDAPDVLRIALPDDAANGPAYAKELRAVGQALEKFKFSDFDLERRDGLYTIRGTPSADLAATFSLIRFIRGLTSGGRSGRRGNRSVEISYSQAEIESLDTQERAKRANSDKLPDPYGISQILRGVGAFLDYRQAQSLLSIRYLDRWVTVQYRSADDRPEQEKQDLDYFYDYWVKMYLRRSNRPKLATSSEPTLYVQWEQDLKRHSISKLSV